MLDNSWFLLLLTTTICIVETCILQKGHIVPETRAVRGGLEKVRSLELGYEEGCPGLRQEGGGEL